MKRRYSLFLDAEQIADVKELSKHNGMTPSENIRRAIQARLNANGVPPKRCPTCKQLRERKA